MISQSNVSHKDFQNLDILSDSELSESENASSSNASASKSVSFEQQSNRTWRQNRINRIEKRIEKYESQIFECLATKYKREYVYIYNNTLKIWTLSVNTESKKTPFVLIHGLCGSIGLWAHNIDKLSESHPVYAFDLLGFGRSSRPDFSKDSVEAENQFVESIEEWRKEMGIAKMILMGHSFGGFLSTAYTLKYPERIRALVLVDPWGFPLPIPQRHSLYYRSLIKLSNHMNPFDFMRTGKTIGMKLLKHFIPNMKPEFSSILGDSDLIYKYIFYSNNLKPSGENAFRCISKKVMYAKNPMINRIHELDRNLPLWFIHGKDSWVDKAGLMVREIRDSYVSVEIIEGARHQIFCEQPEIFNKHVSEILSLVENEEVTSL